jgi:hypothetical protein
MTPKRPYRKMDQATRKVKAAAKAKAKEKALREEKHAAKSRSGCNTCRKS